MTASSSSKSGSLVSTLCLVVLALSGVAHTAAGSVYTFDASYTGFINYEGFSVYFKNVGGVLVGEGGTEHWGENYRGFAKFPLQLPDSETVRSVRLVFHKYGSISTPVAVGVTHVTIDPESVPNLYGGEFYNQIGSGTVLSNCEYGSVEVQERLLMPAAVPAVESCRGQGWIALGFNGGWPVRWSTASLAGAGSGFAPFLEVRCTPPAGVDVRPLAPLPQGLPAIAGRTDTVVWQVTNQGETTAYNCDVTLTLDGAEIGAAALESVAVFETALVSFVFPVTDSVGPHRLACITACDGDRCLANDTASVRLSIRRADTYLCCSFEESEFPPPGWCTYTRSGTPSWTVMRDTTLAPTGVAHAASFCWWWCPPTTTG